MKRACLGAALLLAGLLAAATGARAMHVWSARKVQKPIVTPQGEVIYELIGRAVEHPTERHSVAYITMAPGKGSRKHYHPNGEESFYVLSGEAQVEAGDERSRLVPGDVVLIPKRTPHRIVNVGKSELKFLAVSVPAWEPTDTVWVAEP